MLAPIELPLLCLAAFKQFDNISRVETKTYDRYKQEKGQQ
jgi:hypothetical protein